MLSSTDPRYVDLLTFASRCHRATHQGVTQMLQHISGQCTSSTAVTRRLRAGHSSTSLSCANRHDLRDITLPAHLITARTPARNLRPYTALDHSVYQVDTTSRQADFCADIESSSTRTLHFTLFTLGTRATRAQVRRIAWSSTNAAHLLYPDAHPSCSFKRSILTERRFGVKIYCSNNARLHDWNKLVNEPHNTCTRNETMRKRITGQMSCAYHCPANS